MLLGPLRTVDGSERTTPQGYQRNRSAPKSGPGNEGLPAGPDDERQPVAARTVTSSNFVYRYVRTPSSLLTTSLTGWSEPSSPA